MKNVFTILHLPRLFHFNYQRQVKVHNLKSLLAKSRSFAKENPSLTCHKIVIWENSLFQMFCKLGTEQKQRAKDRGDKRGDGKQKNFLSTLPYIFAGHFLQCAPSNWMPGRSHKEKTKLTFQVCFLSFSTLWTPI